MWVRVLLLLLILIGIADYSLRVFSAHTEARTLTPPVPQVSTPSMCAGNTLPKEIIVSITDRHLWACTGSAVAYNSPVVTGIDYLAADKTPPGTYHIYAKARDRYLTGTDSTGSWNDFVHYWMPFLYNKYGAYGFHDATWRAANAFGQVSPSSSNASHGCVECPLTTAAWLYGWAPIGTTVKIQA